MTTYDAAVIGAGVVGSATAYFMLKKGIKNVLLLEQFSALHSRGSSNGPSRIIRRAYTTPYYVKMMNDAYCLWSDLEKESETTIYTCTGLMMFGPSDNRAVTCVADSLARHNVSHQVFNGHEANKRYPNQFKIPDNYSCVFEEKGGILQAQKAVAAFQQQFIKLGGTLLDNHQVLKIIPGSGSEGSVVTVISSRGTFRAKHLVIAAGAWSIELCSSIGLDLPFTVRRTEAHYWKVDDPTVYTLDKQPVFIGYFTNNEKDMEMKIYSMPILEYPGLLKVCNHGGVALSDPDGRDQHGGPVTAATVSKLISRSLQGVSTKPSITECCIYTLSPDRNPVIDRHPVYSNITIAAGFSGHGFKLSPVVGKMIAELVKGEKPTHDLTPFRVARFLTPVSPL